ncbi:MAG: DUF5681 domain-containing protein [Gammaproteobacteria bacterium]|jgi:hypothetical protein
MTQFQPGQSGNPDGRPKGIKDKRTLYAETIESHAEELINKALEMALKGDAVMLKIFLERILPVKPKDDVVCIELTGNTPTEKSNQVIEALNNQQITPSEAMDIMQALAAQVRVYDADEVAKFIMETKEFVKNFTERKTAA